ncbi:uncharacterized protein JN550_007729 [Neoarthrinium moseri]|uniref:uncharacterized protein n=1 Tax=Neoarthrinium moseri TaxID=1658444 RepID=UPI001FDD02AB|nr:uncharacterized protein JN550_007729 [Neoarthrinium moseri]KAI1866341.1 hypothetical protein JN550_007729 [Neoarthrinium moseri]
MASQIDYSGLQVVPGTSPQVVLDPTLPQVVAGPVPGPERFLTAEKSAAHAYEVYESTQTRRICGFSPRLFYAIVAGAIIVTLAAIGGGIGAALSQRNTSGSGSGPTNSATASTTSINPDKPDAATTQAVASNTRTASTTSTLSVAQTATQIVGPTKTLLRDCPSSNNTIYTSPGTDQQFRKLCNNRFLGTGQNIINRPVTSLNDCIDACTMYNLDAEADIRNKKRVVCSGVCWRNTFNTDFPGQCFTYPLAPNTTDGDFTISTAAKDIECDSAAWINVWSV